MSLNTLTLIATSFFMLGSAHAETSKLDSNTAQQAIHVYKTLRSECAQARGDERKQCFAKLSATTQQYKRAKQFINQPTASPNGQQGDDMTKLADIQ